MYIIGNGILMPATTTIKGMFEGYKLPRHPSIDN
jgi:hypothetical protein